MSRNEKTDTEEVVWYKQSSVGQLLCYRILMDEVLTALTLPWIITNHSKIIRVIPSDLVGGLFRCLFIHLFVLKHYVVPYGFRIEYVKTRLVFNLNGW